MNCNCCVTDTFQLANAEDADVPLQEAPEYAGKALVRLSSFRCCEFYEDFCCLVLLLMTQSMCLRAIHLFPSFCALSMRSRVCFWGWLGLYILHFIFYSCNVLQCLLMRGEGGKKKKSKTGNNLSASKMGNDLAAGQSSSSLLISFFPHVFYSLDSR